MGRSFSRREHERAVGGRPYAADLREWVEDYVATHPDALFDECVAALAAADCPMPPCDGEERLRQVWFQAQVQVLDPILYGLPRRT